MTFSLALLLCFLLLQSEPPHTETIAQEKFALLVGINRYGKLPQSEWLDGCHNDIDAMRSIIVDRFGFKPENVKTLLDDQATAEEIRSRLQMLVQSVQSRSQDATPSQVLFYFSGHGSRIADQPEGHPDCDSEDGFDSTLVVYDSEKQGGDTDIRDDELNKFSHDICKNGRGELLVVLDSCHSGGGARGVTKLRGISRSLEKIDSVDLKNRKFTPKKLPNGTVFLSACQSTQKEPEYEVDGKTFGLLSYHLMKVLQTEQIVSSLDYATLKDVIHRSYQRNKIAQAPTPTIEGSLHALKKTVLGADRSVDRKPYREVKRDDKKRDGVVMEAGKIHDITIHSLFEIFETEEQTLDPNAKSIGWFRITKVEGKFSQGDFFQWKDENRSQQVDSVLPNDFKSGFAMERYHDHGDNVLSIRIVNGVTGTTASPGDPDIALPIRSLLLGNTSKVESNWIRWSGADEQCDVVIRYDGTARLATLFPATGGADDDRETPKNRGTIVIPNSLRGGWGPVEWGTEKGKNELLVILRRVMKVVSLKRLAAEKIESVKTRGSESTAKLDAAILYYNIENKETRPIVSDPKKGLVLEGGEDSWYQVRIKNNDAESVSISILCIGPDMKIQLFAFGPESNPAQFDPEIGLDNNSNANRLESGKEFVAVFGFEEPFGVHTLIILATRERTDFSFLAQDGLTQTRGKKGSGSQILDFIEDQCTVGTRSTTRPPTPRANVWTISSIDIISDSIK